MISFWEKESLLKYDVIVIGSGIVGLQTAVQVKNRHPGHSVLVLERGLLPTGASTRNAGFAATGSLSELVSDAKIMNEEALVNLFSKRKGGLDVLRKQFGDAAIGYRADGSHELLKATEANVLDHLDHFNTLLKDFSTGPLFQIKNECISAFGFDPSYFKYCLSNATEGGLHTGMLIKSLLQLAISKGIEVKTGAEVMDIETFSDRVVIQVQDGFRGDGLDFEAAQVFVCTNAFSKRFFPEEDVQPGRGQVLITKPIDKIPFKGIFHFDEGYYYFRNVGGRVLFGGGRNQDLNTENTTEIELNVNIQEHLKRLLQEKLLPQHTFEIDMQWSGIMAFGDTKMPIVRSLDQRVHGGFRLGGMGVALGSMVALELVELME